ncbi:MAG: hypothetical protein HFE97_01660 [Oscillospiraceae bacterium]|nr:hypothetical protein [Oscillospiraceae bacterium]
MKLGQIAAFGLLCLLTGCSRQGAEAPVQEEATPSPSLVIQPAPADAPQRIAVPSSAAALSDATTYVGIRDNPSGSISFVPVSHVCGGEQQLTGTDHVYSQFSQEFLSTLPGVENLPQTALTDSSHPDSRFAAVASSGAWDLLPVQVKYTAYGLASQPDHPEWSDYFQSQLTETEIDSPVVLAESWQFSWDGVETAIVTASNVQITGDTALLYHTGPSELHALPAEEHTAVYLLSAIFRAGAEPVLLEQQICPVENTRIVNTELGVSYRPTEEGSYQQYLSAVQWDEEGGLTSYPVFCNMNGDGILCNYQYRPDCLLCDLDGDGIPELVVHDQGRSSLMCACTVYRLAEGVPGRSFAVVLN